MGSRATHAVWAYSQIRDRTALVCLLALADNADERGRCGLAQDTLAAQARVSRSTFQASMIAAAKLGEVVYEHRGGTGPRDTNLYRIALVEKLGTLSADASADKRPISARPVGHKAIEAIDTNTHAREPVENMPDPVPPEEVRAHVSEIRRHLLAPRHRDQ